jgi:SAM-dependent methyltransferase
MSDGRSASESTTGDNLESRYNRLLSDYRKLEEEVVQTRKCIQQLIFEDVAASVERQVPEGVKTDGLPLPPASLRYLVAGTEHVPWFLHSGNLGAQTVLETVASAGVPLAAIESALDFGCGCGRIIRHLKHSPFKLHGTDPNSFAIGWCQNYLPFASFTVSSLRPPLSHAASSLDLVYAFSVFTHLPEDLQLAWMSEFKRVLKPSGLLLISLHGPTFLDIHPVLSANELALFSRGRLVTKGLEEVGSNFCNAFHPEVYVRSVLADGFRVLTFVPGGAKGNPPQDVYLLQRS